MDELSKEGYNVNLDKDSNLVTMPSKPIQNFKPIKLEPLYRNRLKILAVSDTHFGSKEQQVSPYVIEA